MVDVQDVNLTYEPFSLEPEYIETNRAFIRRQNLDEVQRFLDLACGNGVVSELLLEASPMAHLNGVDYDPVQIELIEKKFQDRGYTVKIGFDITEERTNDRPILVFGVGSADDLPFPEASFDCVTIANAIHMLPDRNRLLTAIRRVLKPGGLLGFNTSFYAGTFPEGTHQFYMEWLKLATRVIADRSQQRVADGKQPIKRVRGSSHRAFQVRWLSPAEWSQALEETGFHVHDVYEREVMLNSRCFAAVGAYGGLAEVLLSGYPVEESSYALQTTSQPALEACGATEIPRNWLEVWARNPA